MEYLALLFCLKIGTEDQVNTIANQAGVLDSKRVSSGVP